VKEAARDAFVLTGSTFLLLAAAYIWFRALHLAFDSALLALTLGCLIVFIPGILSVSPWRSE
jgi:hypothetical protein